ncbi:hypothetical protein EJO68_17490 [Variovorax atrisoli]|nr:hypothetical protein EJO68_17490 [Variovorax sp. 369]
MAHPQASRTSCRFATPFRGQHLRPGKAGSAVALGSPPGFAHFVSLRHPPSGGQHLRPGKAGSAVFRARRALLKRWLPALPRLAAPGSPGAARAATPACRAP